MLLFLLYYIYQRQGDGFKMMIEINEKIIKRAELKIDKSIFDKVLEMLNNEADYFLKKNFGMKKEIPIEINSRLTRTHGNFSYFVEDKKPIKITISKKFVIGAILMGEMESVLDTLRHELVHYALFVSGKDFSDGEYDFEKTLSDLNIGSSGATTKSKVISKRVSRYAEINPQFKCSSCGKEHSVSVGLTRKNVRFKCSQCKSVKNGSVTDMVHIKFYGNKI